LLKLWIWILDFSFTVSCSSIIFIGLIFL
jgi:hypothetical protein